MAWTEDCQDEIDRLIATQDVSEVIAKAVSGIVEGKLDMAFMLIGHQPSCDPRQVIDFHERLLVAAIDELKKRSS